MGGHSDCVFGTITTNDNHIYKELKRLQELNGTVASEFECGLILRGVKTLRLRQRQHCRNGMALAKFLEAHPKVEKVIYPGLDSHKDRATV
jgi:cystathionine beta-lyase/cystathionine gamma-synthase